jgi:magnesium-transporting ATPase (P-type)
MSKRRWAMAADIVNEVADRNSGDGIAWHSLAEEVVLEKLCSTRGGLEASKVAERQLEFGPNRLPARRPPTLLGILLHQFRSPLIYILLAAAVVSMLLAEFTDAAFIFVVLLLNAGLGMFQGGAPRGAPPPCRS